MFSRFALIAGSKNEPGILVIHRCLDPSLKWRFVCALPAIEDCFNVVPGATFVRVEFRLKILLYLIDSGKITNKITYGYINVACWRRKSGYQLS